MCSTIQYLYGNYIVSLSPESFELMQILGRSPGFPDFCVAFSSLKMKQWHCRTKADPSDVSEGRDYSCGDSSGFYTGIPF